MADKDIYHSNSTHQSFKYTPTIAMFAKLFTLSALAILAAATPALAQGASCSTGAIQCCQTVDTANSTAIAPILGALGIVVQDVNALVGLGCSPISVVGVGSGNAW